MQQPYDSQELKNLLTKALSGCDVTGKEMLPLHYIEHELKQLSNMISAGNITAVQTIQRLKKVVNFLHQLQEEEGTERRQADPKGKESVSEVQTTADLPQRHQP